MLNADYCSSVVNVGSGTEYDIKHLSNQIALSGAKNNLQHLSAWCAGTNT